MHAHASCLMPYTHNSARLHCQATTLELCAAPCNACSTIRLRERPWCSRSPRTLVVVSVIYSFGSGEVWHRRRAGDGAGQRTSLEESEPPKSVWEGMCARA